MRKQKQSARTRRTRRANDVQHQYGPPWPEWMDANQVSAYLGVPAETVRELARRGILPGNKLRGVGKAAKLWRFARASVDSYVASSA